MRSCNTASQGIFLKRTGQLVQILHNYSLQLLMGEKTGIMAIQQCLNLSSNPPALQGDGARGHCVRPGFDSGMIRARTAVLRKTWTLACGSPAHFSNLTERTHRRRRRGRSRHMHCPVQQTPCPAVLTCAPTIYSLSIPVKNNNKSLCL